MNKDRFIKILFLTETLMLAGCSYFSDPVSREDFVNLQQEVSQLKNRVSNQALITSDLNARTNALNARTSTLERKISTNAAAPKKYPYDSAPSLPPVPYSSAVPYSPPVENRNPPVESSPEKKLYDHAYSLYSSGSYNQAISEFQSVIRTYPNGEYADNAQYWIGVVLLKKGDETGAKRAFEKVIQNYPSGNKVQDAETKLRMLQRNQPSY